MLAFCAGCGCFCQQTTKVLLLVSARSGCSLCCGGPAEVPWRAGQALPLVLQASLVWGSVGSIGARLGHHGSCPMRCTGFSLYVILPNMKGLPFSHPSCATCRAERMWRAGPWLPHYGLLAVESRSTRDAAGRAWIWLVLPSWARQGHG